MTDDLCIWCLEKKEYTQGTDPRNNEAIYCIRCPKGHHYCLTKKLYDNVVSFNEFKGYQVTSEQYDSYVKANEESSTDDMLIIGKDFHIDYP